MFWSSYPCSSSRLSYPTSCIVAVTTGGEGAGAGGGAGGGVGGASRNGRNISASLGTRRSMASINRTRLYSELANNRRGTTAPSTCTWIAPKFDPAALASGSLTSHANSTTRSIHDSKFADTDAGVCTTSSAPPPRPERTYKANSNTPVFVFAVEARCNERKSAGKRAFGLCTSPMAVSASEERERVDSRWSVKHSNTPKHKSGMTCFKSSEAMYTSVAIDSSAGSRTRALESEM
mmetsp:Transcript_7378/g.29642  ORF Transcript_7378/g.29642 Transcript_7378/m.29642 type:complete len:235 (-) Transcript_7378:1415-2119(-)